MAYITGKQAFLRILKQEGVSVMFGNPGTTELPLMDGLAREPGIHYVLALQEAVAIAMADAYAQASGGLAAVNVHVSPGLGNAMGMLYDASKSGAPMLLTAGQHDQGFNATEPILWSDLPPMAAPLVKWSTEARRLEDLPRIVHRAVKTAFAHPSGPVFLSLPVDVLNAERDLDLSAPTRVAPRIVGDRAAVARAAELLAKAQSPVIVAGDAVAHGDAPLKGFSAEDDRYVAMDLDRPQIDFVGLARSLGCAGTKVEKASDIGPAVSRALASGGPHLVDVRIDGAI